MLVIDCPYCGPRNSTEFRHAGEAGKSRDVANSTPAEWRRYLYEFNNPLGWVREHWFHSSGCRRYISSERHTGNNEVRWVVPFGTPAPSTTSDKETGA
ncbi:MAG: sarcosine oxidase subunit delta [Actinomycetes bacterium]|jgi:heterotetrameric sarcosine oxidase delta subunit